MSEKKITPPAVSPGAEDAAITQVGSIVVLSDDEVERVAGGISAVEYGVLGAVIVTAVRVDGKQVGGTLTASAT